MKAEARELVCRLRREGHSLNEILRQVPVSRSTASVWVRDIRLSPAQIERLRERTNHRAAGREVFRQVMRAQREARWAQFHAAAEHEWESLRHDPQFMFGLALYIGEGSKSEDCCVSLTNCNAGVITKGIEFFVKLGVPSGKIKVALHLHPGLCEETARAYWQQTTGLPLTQFYRTVWAVSRASSGKKGHIQPCGTCRIVAYSVRIRQKLEVWMRLALYGSWPAP